MAILKRANGDANGVVSIDRNLASTATSGVVSTGVTKRITAYKITGVATMASEYGVGGAVESILRVIQMNATVIAYQVDTTQLSVIVESSGWGTGAGDEDSALQTAIRALGNRSADANIPVSAFDFSSAVVASTGGIKIA